MNAAAAYNILPFNHTGQLVPYSGNTEPDNQPDYTRKQTQNDHIATQSRLKYYVKSSVDDVMYTRDQVTTTIISEPKGALINLFA